MNRCYYENNDSDQTQLIENSKNLELQSSVLSFINYLHFL